MNHPSARKATYAIAAALLAALASTVAASAACPTNLYYADLKTGFIAGGGSPVTVLHAMQPTTSTDPLCAGWKETVLRIPIPARPMSRKKANRIAISHACTVPLE